jgi:hypothetical protein
MHVSGVLTIDSLCVGGPEGCGSGKSEVQASPEQKRAFQAVVQSLVGTGQQFTVQAQD